VVNAGIDQPRDEPVELDFIVVNTAQGPKVRTSRSRASACSSPSDDAVVAEKGIDGLIQAMRQKVSEEPN
jgi:hypothetical protein